MIPPRPVRILHVVGGMTRAGIETWLMHVLRHIDRTRFSMDFLVHTDQSCAYDEEINSLGSRVLPCLRPSRPWSYARNFRRILREEGPYDVVHSHVHHFSGFVLRLARQAGVPMRIAHSHLDDSGGPDATLARRMYLGLMTQWIEKNATIGLAASRQAASALFGLDWEKKRTRTLLNYGIDLSAFRTEGTPRQVRAELGIPADAFVVGHVGRFHEQKNHAFLIDIFAEMARRLPKTHLLLAGVGDLRTTVERKIDRLHLTDRVTFVGSRPDVPRLMLGAMNAFVFPSHYEGLGIAAVEAQAAGIPCYLSDVIPAEATVVPALVRRLSLAAPASAWAGAIVSARDQLSVGQREACALVEASCFNIRTGIHQLEAIYGDAGAQEDAANADRREGQRP